MRPFLIRLCPAFLVILFLPLLMVSCKTTGTGKTSSSSQNTKTTKTKVSAPGVASGASRLSVLSQPNHVAVPEGLNTDDEIMLARIVVILREFGLVPVIGAQAQMAPYRLRFTLKNNIFSGREAVILLHKGAIPVMSAKASRTIEEGKEAGKFAAEEVFTECLVRFETRMKQANFRP